MDGFDMTGCKKGVKCTLLFELFWIILQALCVMD